MEHAAAPARTAAPDRLRACNEMRGSDPAARPRSGAGLGGSRRVAASRWPAHGAEFDPEWPPHGIGPGWRGISTDIPIGRRGGPASHRAIPFMTVRNRFTPDEWSTLLRTPLMATL